VEVYPGRNDEARILRVERDPIERFEAVALPHLDAAYTLARYLMRDDAAAQDVVQEAFLRALKYFDRYRGGDARAWVLAIVRNTSHTWRRQQGERGAPVEFDERVHSESIEAHTPEAALLRAADRDMVRRALDQLPLELREVIVLREIQGLSYKEIAAVAGIPIGTVMSRLSRARARLEQLLGALAGRE
jgi:RNA polymerase sigma-70 factor (ECF subfamily)